MLHLFQIINRYIKLKNGTDLKQNQVHLFGGKASPSDHLGKQIIHCIVLVADTINNDASIENRLKVLFIPDYGMSWAEKIIPAAEVSEQISAPRFDTCGTSAMKLALNGALTLASYTGANKELIDHIGGDNIFPVGMPESHYPSTETYVPAEILSSSEALNTIYSFLETLLNQTANGTAVFPLISQIRDVDDYFILHDFESYRQQHEKIETLFQDKISWLRMSLLNIARTGWFSSDRATSQYAQNIWKVSPA